ncbi:alpha-glucosidase [Sphaerotilus sp.]|uniref:glycoside hydrolase family 13 protein n=1 Tax=Sphaerotilus sp. TaxID=2093942 RepID=UPI00286E8423|nr:alpha-glucosidase [Sphaerotilus sp.]
MTARPDRDWWKQSVVYQIYPRSFCDSNGDGVGDLPGITSKLDHLQALGVDVVWLSPVYASPQDDNGYDISDYRAIAPEFGTMAEFDEMLAQMHARGIRLMMDLVVNHSSDEHAWFREARKSRDNPYHDHYIWREPQPDGSPPTNWEAAFNGSVWEWNAPTGEYYLHMFSPKQPDLNWENPALRAEVHEAMRFWLDKGVDGFRMDVINMISKPWNADGSLPDASVVREGFLQPGFALTCNGPRLLEFLREMREQVLDHYDTITVGEAPLATITQGRELTNPQTGALSMLFQFEHMDLDSVGGHMNGKWALKPLDLRDLKATMTRWQDALYQQGWNSLYLNNHDQPRPVSRFGDDGAHRVVSAKMLGTFLHGMQGTPYVYQGEELGMTNVGFESIEDYQDIEIRNMYRVATEERGQDPAEVMRSIHAKGRDNARTPMPWDGSPNAGFTTGTPWLKLNPNFPQINAAQAVADPDSVFHHYQRLIALRRAHPVLVHGRYDLLLPDHAQIYAYTRTLDLERWLIVCNFGGETPVFDLPAEAAASGCDWMLGNCPPCEGDPLHGSPLRPWEARMLRLHA